MEPAPPAQTPAHSEPREAPSLEDLLTALSHELRSPLQAILSWAQLLRASPNIDPFTERAFLAIERNVRWQVDVIENILELSQLLAGELPLERQPLAVSSFVEEAVHELSADAAVRRIRLTRTVEADEPKVLGDPRAVRSLVRSLLGHSLQHGSEGGSIDVDVRRTGALLQLTVREVGPQAQDSKLTETDPFREGGASSTRRFDGLGVGLMKVQRLVEMHGGTVCAESEGAGRGALFAVSLPLASES